MSLVMRGLSPLILEPAVMDGLSPPVIVEPAVMGGASPPVKKPLFRTGGDDYFPTIKNIFRYQYYNICIAYIIYNYCSRIEP